VTAVAPAARGPRLGRGASKRLAAPGVTLVALVIVLVVCAVMQPRILSADGFGLVYSSVVALVLASLAQMVMMSIGDIDLGIGAFVGLVTAVGGTVLSKNPLLGILVLLGLVAAYMLLGALVQLRSVPSLIATLGASFIWLGLGLFLLPTPGGLAPDWLTAYAGWAPPLVPGSVIVVVVATAAVWWLMMRTGVGVRLRGFGSNPVAVTRAGTSALGTRVLAYAIVAVLGILAGLALTSEIGGGDVHSADGYTLTSVAAVILGGGTFFGGRSAAWGTLFGATALGLLTVLLSLLQLPSNIQPAIQGAIVIAALAGRLLVEKVVK
jgi:ribose transport system permease protein